KNTAQAAVEGVPGAGSGPVLQAGSVDVEAKNKANIASLTGQVSVGFQGAAAGAAIVVNLTLNETTARLADIDVTAVGRVGVTTENQSTIRTVAVSAGVSGGQAAVSASLNASHIQNKSTAELLSAGGHAVNAASLAVRGTDQSKIHALAGQA